jgi:hypothetical protein
VTAQINCLPIALIWSSGAGKVPIDFFPKDENNQIPTDDNNNAKPTD